MAKPPPRRPRPTAIGPSMRNHDAARSPSRARRQFHRRPGKSAASIAPKKSLVANSWRKGLFQLFILPRRKAYRKHSFRTPHETAGDCPHFAQSAEQNGDCPLPPSGFVRGSQTSIDRISPCSASVAAAMNCGRSSRKGLPSSAVITPPASQTISQPAATSQIKVSRAQ